MNLRFVEAFYWVAEILEHHTGLQMCEQAKAEREKASAAQRQMLELRVMPA
jgi:hypothetical protein